MDFFLKDVFDYIAHTTNIETAKEWVISELPGTNYVIEVSNYKIGETFDVREIWQLEKVTSK